MLVCLFVFFLLNDYRYLNDKNMMIIIIIIITLMSFKNSEKPEWLYKNQHQIFRLPSPTPPHLNLIQ